MAWSCVWLNHTQSATVTDLHKAAVLQTVCTFSMLSRGFASFVLIELTGSDAMASKEKFDCFPSLISYTFFVAYSII